MIVLALIVAGLCFGSFVNALAWRLHQQEHHKPKTKNQKRDAQFSILSGRSMCPHCKHELAVMDLIPVVSWIMLKGRCRYCQKPISWQYPLVEAALAAVFVVSYLFWPVDLSGGGQWLLFITWLASSVGLMALAVYDLRWMLLPNRILYPTLAVAASGRLAYILFFSPDIAHSLWLLALSLAVASGIFWVLYEVSKGRWIGFGDVRLGLVTGTLLAAPDKAFLMIFAASVLGTAFVAPALLAGRQTLAGKLPYGPFLIAATGICVLVGDSVIHWYQRVFLP